MKSSSHKPLVTICTYEVDKVIVDLTKKHKKKLEVLVKLKTSIGLISSTSHSSAFPLE